VIAQVGDEQDLVTNSAKQCPHCGYFHPIKDQSGVDTCERCKQPLEAPWSQLFRLRNVSTKRRDRITSDEEERLKMGYEIKTCFRFDDRDGLPLYRTAKVLTGEQELATLSYGHTATIWRVNLGWRRRANTGQLGFMLDKERGYWPAIRLWKRMMKTTP